MSLSLLYQILQCSTVKETTRADSSKSSALVISTTSVSLVNITAAFGVLQVRQTGC